MYCIVMMRIVDVKVLFRYLIYTILTIFAYMYIYIYIYIMVLQCINGVGSNPVEGRTKI